MSVGSVIQSKALDDLEGPARKTGLIEETIKLCSVREPLMLKLVSAYIDSSFVVNFDVPSQIDRLSFL